MNADSWLTRRSEIHRPRRLLWLMLGVPSFITGRFLYEHHRAVEHPTLVGAVAAGAIVYVLARFVLDRTLLAWQSRHIRPIIRIWMAYSALTVLVFLVQTGSRLFLASEAYEVLDLAASVRLPLAEVAPAVLLGPVLWALARDAYALGGRSQTTAVWTGGAALVALLLVPLVAYLGGAWWAAQPWLPHFTTFAGFRRMILALAASVVAAAVFAWAGMVLDLHRTRRLESEVAI